ncbi:MAG: BLUF domain-containing protein [Massilia sp.]
MLVRLLYASRATGTIPADAIHDIMRQSHAHNPAQGITGILCHSDKIFMQVLEGGRGPVNALYAKILRDPRHTDVVLLHYEEITERRYAGWTMGQANLARANPSTLLRFSDLPVLNPHCMSGSNSMALMDELMASATIVGRA